MMGEEVYEHFRNSAVKSRKATESRMAASVIFFRYQKIYPFPPFFILTILDRIISIINYFSLRVRFTSCKVLLFRIIGALKSQRVL